MAFVRPIVYVYQEFQNVVVAPDTPDLNCCVVGPAYHIQDYPADSSDIQIADFVKAGETADAGCLATGASAGQPDPGASFLVLSEPPNNTSGGLLDSTSLDVVFDDVYIDVTHNNDGEGDDGAGVGQALAAGDFLFHSDLADFVTAGVTPGDRLVMTNTANPGDATKTVVKTVKEVTSANVLHLTSTFKTADIALIGTGSILWRVEHRLDDQSVDTDLYTTIVGNQITIKTGPTGILLAYNDTTYAVNFANMYVGYRSLRTDLQTVQEVTDTTLTSKVGRLDERNPLCVGVNVALSNTGTPVQAYGVASDDNVGHGLAADALSTQDDIYAIVPITDPTTGMSGATWTSGPIATWKTHVLDQSTPEKARFRILIGSYDVLPTEKASAPASTVGWTTSVGPDSTDDVDVFVDPAATTEFVTDSITASHLLDITHADGTPAILTMANGTTMFTDGYGGAKTLLGAMGEKRLRLSASLGTRTAMKTTGERVDYAVREAILASEGGTAVANVEDVNWTDNTVVQITKPGSGAFSTVSVGDVAHVTGAATAAHNDGFLVIAQTADSIDIEFPYAVDANTGSIDVKVYSAVGYANDATITGNNLVTKAGQFTEAAIGDMAVFLVNSDGSTTNRGVFVVTAVTDDTIQVAVDGTYDLTDVADANVVFWHTKASRGVASITTRERLTRLRDDTASFLSTVLPGENIEIPYPADTDPTKWDTATTKWPIDAVVSDELLDADLEALEELAPDTFIEGFDGDMPYRISIELDKDGQVTELGTITSSLASSRVVMTWPNEVLVSGVENEATSTQSRQPGQYLACAVGGMIAGLPSHQGFTFIGIGGVQQIFNSNDYFTDDQLTALRNDGWYVFAQDSETSLPYSIHEVTTDVDTYAFGELMNVKNFDYISLFYKEILVRFLGRYNILPETISTIVGSLNAGTNFLQLRRFPKIGAPLLTANVGLIEQIEADRLEIYVEITMPTVLNQIGLHLLA
jgi:hypothetical protein